MRKSGLAALPVSVLLLLAPALFPGTGHGAGETVTGEEPPPLLLRGDGIVFDHDSRDAGLAGRAELARQGVRLTADTILRRGEDGELFASGNVTLLFAGRLNVNAVSARFRSDFLEGEMRTATGVLDGNRYFSAGSVRLLENGDIALRDVTFTSCAPCARTPDAPPPWRIRAGTSRHERATGTMTHRDLVLEVRGVPVAWMPQLSHPGPETKRRTGLLAPGFGYHSTLGAFYRQPVFLVLSGHADLTVTPYLYTRARSMLRLVWRRAFRSGRATLQGYAVSDSLNPGRLFPGAGTGNAGMTGKDRFLLRGEGDFVHPGTGIRYGFLLDRASDGNFPDEYGLYHGDTLVSRLYARKEGDSSLASISAHAYQGLLATRQQERIPLVMPEARWVRHDRDGPAAGRLTMAGGLLALHRKEGASVRRLSFSLGNRWKSFSENGHVYGSGVLLEVALRDISRRGEGQPPGTGNVHVAPSAYVDWRWPLVRPGPGGTTLVVEPMLLGVIDAGGQVSGDVPNEDSRFPELDDVSLFSMSRFAGIDRREPGARLSHAVRLEMRGRKGWRSGLLLGQIVRDRKLGDFPSGSGLAGKRSDYAGRAFLSLGDWLDLAYRFRLDRKDFSLRRQDASAELTLDRFRLEARYYRGYREEPDGTAGRDETLHVRLGVRFSRNLSLEGTGGYDLRTRDFDRSGLRLSYLDECLELSAGVAFSGVQAGSSGRNREFTFRVRLLGVGL